MLYLALFLKTLARSLLAALIVTGMLLANPVSAAGLRRGAPHSEEAIEAHHIALSVDAHGRGELLAYPCASCAPRTLKMDGPVMVWTQGRPNPGVNYQSLNGHEATVIYDITSEQVLRLIQ